VGNKLTVTSAPTKDLAGQDIVFVVTYERVEVGRASNALPMVHRHDATRQKLPVSPRDWFFSGGGTQVLPLRHFVL